MVAWLFAGLYVVKADMSPIGNCQNLLFQTHWFTPIGNSRCLSEYPSVHDSLVLCPVYTGVPSCCREAFEEEQLLHFSLWKEMLSSKLVSVKRNKDNTQLLEKEPIFNAASNLDRAQWQEVLQTYDEVLDPTRGHARCFTSLLTYVAGMLCFACDGHWQQAVQKDEGKLIRVLLTDRSCAELGASCASFGRLARRLRESVLGSSLAMRQTTPLERLEMFEDQQTLCDWAHNAIAMHPFSTSLESQREAMPPSQALERRLNGTDSWISYDTLIAGKASGFDLHWAGSGRRGQAFSRHKWSVQNLLISCLSCAAIFAQMIR